MWNICTKEQHIVHTAQRVASNLYTAQHCPQQVALKNKYQLIGFFTHQICLGVPNLLHSIPLSHEEWCWTALGGILISHRKRVVHLPCGVESWAGVIKSCNGMVSSMRDMKYIAHTDSNCGYITDKPEVDPLNNLHLVAPRCALPYHQSSLSQNMSGSWCHKPGKKTRMKPTIAEDAHCTAPPILAQYLEIDLLHVTVGNVHFEGLRHFR